MVKVNVLHGSEAFQGIVRSEEVVDTEGLGEFFTHSRDGISEEAGSGIEFLPEDAVGSFHSAIIGGFGRGKHHKGDMELRTG